MVLSRPKLFLRSSLSEEDSSNLSSDVFKISAPSGSFGLMWSIFLSYLISLKTGYSYYTWDNGYESVLGTDSEISNLLENGSISCRPDVKSIRNIVYRFNPFRNWSNIYSHQKMIDAFRLFELKLLNAFRSIMNTNEEHFSNEWKLKTAAEMLECQIVLITEHNGTSKVACEPPYPKDPLCKKLVIFLEKDIPDGFKTVDIYGFGLSLEHSVSFKLDILGDYLKFAKVNILDSSQIKENFRLEDNFLQFLLSSKWNYIVPNIYKSPYIAWKLSEAGFNTDPCAMEQNRLSALGYCLFTENFKYFTILYNYAVNYFQKFDFSLRNPNNIILECLKSVSKTIKKDWDYAKNNFANQKGIKKDLGIKTTQQILRFNEFQSFWVEEMCNILPKFGESITNHKEQFVVSILKKYFEYFQYPSIPSTDNDADSFKNYVEYSLYYENLDNFTCMTFFDKILLLNSVKDTNNFKNTVLYLFTTVLSYKMFPKCGHGYNCSICRFTTDNCAKMFISFNFRNKFRNFGEKYMLELQTDNINESVNTKKTLDNVRLSLKDFPVITEEFLIKRLERYLRLSIEASFDIGSLKGLLVIERSLQVIGETLIKDNDSQVIVAHLICSCLPKDCVSALKKIRNHCLSHYKAKTMYGRINLETDIERVKALQNNLKTLNDMLEPVYLSQEFRTEEFLISESEADCKIFSKDILDSILKERQEFQQKRKEKYEQHKIEYKLLSQNVLEYTQQLIESSESERENKIKNNFKALKWVFSFIAEQCNISMKNKILAYVLELENLLNTDAQIIGQLENDVINNIAKQRNLISEVFKDILSKNHLPCGNFSEINRYLGDVISARWFTDGEISDIQTLVTKYLERSNDAWFDLKQMLQSNPLPSKENVNKLLEDIFMSIENKNEILESFEIDPNKSLKTLVNNYTNVVIFETMDKLVELAQKEPVKSILLKIKNNDEWDYLEDKMLTFLNRKLECLLNRIKHMKEILIEDDEEIASLREWGKSSGIQKHTRFLMGQRYMLERDVRASLEMLLFDCMNILFKKKSDLEVLWTKATNLFSGANLRDVLSHGNTALEVVGGLLDPEDLPSQLINKILELIEDEEGLRDMSDTWRETKGDCQEELKEIVNRQILKKKSQAEQEAAKKKWTEYLSLLPS